MKYGLLQSMILASVSQSASLSVCHETSLAFCVQKMAKRIEVLFDYKNS